MGVVVIKHPPCVHIQDVASNDLFLLLLSSGVDHQIVFNDSKQFTYFLLNLTFVLAVHQLHHENKLLAQNVVSSLFDLTVTHEFQLHPV